MDRAALAGVIWVPLTRPDRQGLGRAPFYRRCLRLLVPEALQETAAAAEAAVDHLLAAGEAADAARVWAGHGGALVVYAMWALYELRDRGVIDRDEFDVRLKWLATIQYEAPRRGQLWLPPAWWGSDVHEQHHAALNAITAGQDPRMHTP